MKKCLVVSRKVREKYRKKGVSHTWGRAEGGTVGKDPKIKDLLLSQKIAQKHTQKKTSLWRLIEIWCFQMD